MKMHRIFLLFAAVILLSGCTEWAMDSTEQGWDDFEDGDIAEARTHFEDAIGWDITYPDAYNGLGWCDLLDDEFLNSLVNFETALEYELSFTDASAGGALAATEAGEHSKAVNFADDVISANSSYEFSHMTSVDINIIRLAKAKSAAASGDFSTCLEEIQEFDDSFTADPYSSQGQAEILSKLEELVGMYGAWVGN